MSLFEARQSLNNATKNFNTLKDASPPMLEAGVVLSELWGRQHYLEKMEGALPAPSTVGESLQGLPLLIGGAVLGVGALGTWAWKQYEETKQMETYMDCLSAQQARGLSPQEAAAICRPYGGLMSVLKKAGWVLAGLTLLWFIFKI